MNRPPGVDVDVTTHGEFPGADEYVQAKIGGLARLARRPIIRARVRLTRHQDPAVAQPVIAQANLDVGGRQVRAQVTADSAREAVDALESRLRRRLEHLTEHWDARKGHGAAPPWRHDDKPGRGPQVATGAGPEPRIVRRKSYAMAPCTLDEAVTEMELLDYDFHLFTESGSGTAAVVYRDGPAGYRAALVAPSVADALAPHQGRVTVSTQPLPCLREQDALERLALLDRPFLFFVDAAQGRVGVLYRRYDGDYGLITPAGPS
ncbi:HPF/RaiA family ribosome-associated protein [Mycobacterium sp. ITM-2016-00317]|uniref:ribosome hibernation promotion factor n=1 Tax=Mycobacterium sp. ITM-2016-00317 TaxID=2099694 RepID=UPI000D3F3D27|nr:HPF/RaiA family ribosome-associated protein [Mycobacterium sp. ITM-2016-00317]WNG88734.1 HPF/RaiA family ribosome-associated protein [Mycobacterium sp. ITM-2016-00317]